MSAADVKRLNAENEKLRTEVQRLTWATLGLVTKLEASAMRVVQLSEKLAPREPAPAKPTRYGGGR